MIPSSLSPVSSEDEDDELIFSDELAERGSDTDSMENLETVTSSGLGVPTNVA